MLALDLYQKLSSVLEQDLTTYTNYVNFMVNFFLWQHRPLGFKNKPWVLKSFKTQFRIHPTYNFIFLKQIADGVWGGWECRV